MIIGVSGKIGSGKDTVGKIIQYLTLEQDSKLIWQIKKFAGKLKECVSIITGIPVKDLEKEEVKRSRLPECWHDFDINNHYVEPDTVRELLQKFGTEVGRQLHPNTWVNALFSDYELTPNVNIKITDTGHPSRSIEEAFDIMKPDNHIYPNWIITDVRFPNEAEAIKDRGGITIRVERFTSIKNDLVYFKNDSDDDPINGIYRILEVKKDNCTLIDDKTRCSFGARFEEISKINEHESETALDNYQFDYEIDNNGTIEELIVEVKEILIKEKVI